MSLQCHVSLKSGKSVMEEPAQGQLQRCSFNHDLPNDALRCCVLYLNAIPTADAQCCRQAEKHDTDLVLLMDSSASYCHPDSLSGSEGTTHGGL